jgi:mRNA interferase MazF
MEIARGDVVLIVLQRELGKPRPAVVIQADQLGSPLTTIVCPMSSDVGDSTYLRPIVKPSSKNGLHVRSQLMTDKITAVARERIRTVLGRLDPEDQSELDQALLVVLGLTG